MNTNRGIEATYTDQFGESRIIHATRQGFTRKRQSVSPVLALNQVAGRLVGLKVRALRKERGWTLEQLCTRAGLISATPKSRMHEIEIGSRKQGVRLGTLYALAEALGVEAFELLPTTREMIDAAGVTTITVQKLVKP